MYAYARSTEDTSYVSRFAGNGPAPEKPPPSGPSRSAASRRRVVLAMVTARARRGGLLGHRPDGTLYERPSHGRASVVSAKGRRSRYFCDRSTVPSYGVPRTVSGPGRPPHHRRRHTGLSTVEAGRSSGDKVVGTLTVLSRADRLQYLVETWVSINGPVRLSHLGRPLARARCLEGFLAESGSSRARIGQDFEASRGAITSC